MALRTLAPQEQLYKKGAMVEEIALVIKGSVSMQVGKETMLLGSGNIVGLCEQENTPFKFNYIANEETTVYTYAYTGIEDLDHLLSENGKLSTTITANLLRQTSGFSALDRELHEKASLEYEKVKADLKRYPSLCASTGTQGKDFSALNNVKSPDTPCNIPDWKFTFFNAIAEHEPYTTPLFSLGYETCVGFLMTAVEFLREISVDIVFLMSKLDVFHIETAAFKAEVATLASEAEAIESGSEVLVMPPMEESLEQIISYCEYDAEKAADINEIMDSYTAIPNRTDTNDTLRTLRRKIAPHYYDIYKLALLKSIDDPNPPAPVKMFLLYGYMDERLVTEEDIKKLYGYSCAYRYDGSKYIPVYHWLLKVYRMEVEPSLNEFQQDYPTYLKELATNGDIRKEEIEDRLNDPMARLDFELRNMFALGNRMTFGRPSLFAPVFDSQQKILPLEKSQMTTEILNAQFDRIRSLDFTIFYRHKHFVMPNNETIQFFIHEEQTPFVILFPNVGQNMVLWQTIEGRKRNSPSRMFISIFFDDNLEDSVTKACADYRWEVCKTDQGPRWTDITDPSLTAEFHDFLQFYKKNSSLSPDNKEKVKTMLKKQSNNYKKVFINEYLQYIKYESAGNMRLLKSVREVIFKYCPFKKEKRDELASSPVYEKLIDLRTNKLEQKIRPLHNLVQKASKNDEVVPEEILQEIDYLKS